MARKERQSKIKAILLISMIFTWFLCLPIMAEEKISKEFSYSNGGLKGGSFIIDTSPVPLESESKISVESFTLVNTEIRGLKTSLNFDPKRININPDPSRRLNKHIKMNRVENSLYTTFLITHTILNVADYVTTVKGLKYECLQESNPLMKPFIKNPYIFAAVKVGITTLNFYLMKKLHKKNKIQAWIVSTISNFITFYFVANNIKMIRRAQGM